jgi:hypothetical protein
VAPSLGKRRKLINYFHLMPRSRIMGLYLHSSIYLQNIGLKYIFNYWNSFILGIRTVLSGRYCFRMKERRLICLLHSPVVIVTIPGLELICKLYSPVDIVIVK